MSDLFWGGGERDCLKECRDEGHLKQNLEKIRESELGVYICIWRRSLSESREQL